MWLVAFAALLIGGSALPTCSGTGEGTSSELANLALGGTCAQSSEAFGAPALLAIDGKPHALHFWEGQSCSHTASETAPWWAVALGPGGGSSGAADALYAVASVTVRGRDDGCCRGWLRGLRVALFNLTTADSTAADAAAGGGGAQSRGALLVAAARKLVARGGADGSAIVCGAQLLGVEGGAAAADGMPRQLQTVETLACPAVAQALVLTLPPPQDGGTQVLSLCEVEVAGHRLWEPALSERDAWVRQAALLSAPTASSALIAGSTATPFVFGGTGSASADHGRTHALLTRSIVAAAADAAERMALFEALAWVG